MKVIFMGTPDFAVGTLEALHEAGHEITLVVSQPDKPKGRGLSLIHICMCKRRIFKKKSYYLQWLSDS